PASNILVMTFSPESDAKVRGRTNSWAACVITTCTRMSRSCSRRTISAALYAAIPPVTPSATFIKGGRKLLIWMPKLFVRNRWECRAGALRPRLRPPTSGFRGSPSLLFQRGFHPERYGRAFGSLFPRLAAHHPGAGGRGEQRRECSGNCCRSLRSTSYVSPP